MGKELAKPANILKLVSNIEIFGRRIESWQMAITKRQPQVSCVQSFPMRQFFQGFFRRQP